MPDLQIIVLIVYFIAIFGVGVYASRFVGNTTDFLLAGRRLGLVLATATLCATHFGGGFVMGSGEWGFQYGLTGIAYAAGVGLSLVALGLVAARRMRRLAMFTVPDYLALRYRNEVVRILGALLSLVAIIGIIGAQVWAAQGALSIVGLDPTWAAIAATGLFIVYTAMSGLWGVTLTDAVQLGIVFIGVPVAAFMALGEAGGIVGMRTGIEGLEVAISRDAYFSPLGAGLGLVLAAIVPTMMYTLIGQDFYQRLFAARDENTARRAAILAGLLLVLFAVFPVITGMAARALFGGEIEAAQAIPKLIAEVLPSAAAAIVIAAIIGAIMSTADSLLVAGSAHVTNDLYARLIKPDVDIDGRQLLLISRGVTVVIGVLALWMALAFEAIIDLLLMSYTLYAAGVFVPVVLGLYWQRGNAAGAIAAILGGSGVGVAGELGWFEFAGLPLIGGFPVIVIGALASLVLHVTVSLLTPPRERHPALE
ncbi:MULTISPECIES: sodium:solute symporter [unclassified Wenzhouxiangella]|uniref:sodium:solute symporter family protein n=1 Tax=unclassified Wenzhouxiangella TaxID=2613841 RepID=UPI000E32C7AB|nr:MULTISPECIES: sodium:solute symporter family protein [unclassified Wenzhouxiangella]RFF28995.1 sodium:solute symporter family protein [Wenzhouxiangella sp. 15181]RFP68299.1 sodium:solute symporter family protein [Wenzhouxiangella sp. 15190]